MVVGKTSPVPSKDDIFNIWNEPDILSHCFGVNKLPCLVHSPLREDHNPSFQFYLNKNGRVKFLDYATDEHGDIWDLLCKYWHCSSTQALLKAKELIPCNKGAGIERANYKRKNVGNIVNLEVKTRAWEEYDYNYWKEYGVLPTFLHWARVFPISHKIITKRNPTTKGEARIVFKADKYAYVFVEYKDFEPQLKIYQPFNTKGFKWCSHTDHSVISLWDRIPQQGDKVIICSSLKDALCVSSQLVIPTLALQGESYHISKTAADELRKRYKKIYISYDTDAAGKKNSEKLAEETGFTNIIPDLDNEKDFSDYYKSLKNKDDFKKLKTLFI